MITVYSEEHLLHDPLYEFDNGELRRPFEQPERSLILLQAIKQVNLGPIIQPKSFDTKYLRSIHSNDYVDFLQHAYELCVISGNNPNSVLPTTLAVRWMSHYPANPIAKLGYYFFDLSSPIVENTYYVAQLAVNIALTGADLILAGEKASYALCRPPGHHAGTNLAGGYCFFNNAAIAAQYLLDEGKAKRIAILDIDVHHGNGTQQIFYTRSDVTFVSIHVDPITHYPFFTGYSDEVGINEGIGHNLNIPLPARTNNINYLVALETALKFINDHAPNYLIVSIGLDTYVEDPIGGLGLTHEVYAVIGSLLAQLKLPTLFVQEGGYAMSALGTNLCQVLLGFEDSL